MPSHDPSGGGYGASISWVRRTGRPSYRSRILMVAVTTWYRRLRISPDPSSWRRRWVSEIGIPPGLLWTARTGPDRNEGSSSPPPRANQCKGAGERLAVAAQTPTNLPVRLSSSLSGLEATASWGSPKEAVDDQSGLVNRLGAHGSRVGGPNRENSRRGPRPCSVTIDSRVNREGRSNERATYAVHGTARFHASVAPESPPGPRSQLRPAC